MGSKQKGDKRTVVEVGEEGWSSAGPPSPVNMVTNDTHNKPAEVYRKDLISAMKLPDWHALSAGSYVFLEDQWRQEWERGVQVPVNPEGLQTPSFRMCPSLSPRKAKNFKLSGKMISSKGNNVRTRESTSVPYDLDEMDTEWLKFVNRTRHNRGLPEVDEIVMEKAISYFENKCYDNMCIALATAKGLSREFDENVCCDVCQSPDVEENNEIIFCDACDIGVHQACYGVQKIPFGSWLCKPCSRVLTPTCALCPNQGGAMKKTKDGKQWCHVSCALWIPEVGVGSVEKMEPITRIDNIPASRWNLVCFLCREKVGACIQCSVKSCITAFHVTCGFQHDLPMKTVLDDNATDGVRHVCYCAKHSNRMKSPSKDKDKEKNDQPEESKRDKKLREMEEEFYRYVDINESVKDLNITKELATRLHAYWTHKRKVRDDVPLLPPTAEQQEKLTGKKGLTNNTDQSNEMERFVLLRQDLERVRNLCYMVNKREKMRRELWRAQELVFRKQVEILTDDSLSLSKEDVQRVIDSCKGNFLYHDDPEEVAQDHEPLQACTSTSASCTQNIESSAESTADSHADVRGDQAVNKPNGLISSNSSTHNNKKRRSQTGWMGKRKRRRKSHHNATNTSQDLAPSNVPDSSTQPQLPEEPSKEREVHRKLNFNGHNVHNSQATGIIVDRENENLRKKSNPEIRTDSGNPEKVLKDANENSSEFNHNSTLDSRPLRRSTRSSHSDDARSLGNDSSSAAESDADVKEKIHEVRQLRNRLKDASEGLSPSRNTRSGLTNNSIIVAEKDSNSSYTQKNNHTKKKETSSRQSSLWNKNHAENSILTNRTAKVVESQPLYVKRTRVQRIQPVIPKNKDRRNSKQHLSQQKITRFLRNGEKSPLSRIRCK